jgi:dTMP kinase
MAERTENSVLVSLRELRGIEDDRIRREQEEVRARAEAERAATEAAERRARQEDEDRRRAEELRLQRIEEDKQTRLRDEHLRIEEAERRARVESEMKLQEQKMRLEIQSRAEGRSPVKAIAAVALVLAAIGGGIVYKIQAAHAERERIAEQEARARHEAANAENAELRGKLAAITRDMDQKLKLANSEAEQAKIRAAAAAKRAAVTEEHSAAKVSSKKTKGPGAESAAKPAGGRMPGKIEIKDDDILKGL